jgi:hypothetical protein
MTESYAAEPQDETSEVVDEVVEPGATGHTRIDEAVSRLAGLDDLEITHHPEEFDAIHRVLRESLASAGRDGNAPDAP